MKPVLTALALAGAFLFALGNLAKGHGPYEMACCSDRDCAPVPDDRVAQISGGFLVDGEFVPMRDPRVRRPINEQFHLCKHVTTGALLCIYPKLQGF